MTAYIFFSDRDLSNKDRFWIDLARASSSDPFSWSDGKIQADLTLGDIVHSPRNNAGDDELCVAIKWSNGNQMFITRIESCSLEWFPFCEVDTGKKV